MSSYRVPGSLQELSRCRLTGAEEGLQSPGRGPFEQRTAQEAEAKHQGQSILHRPVGQQVSKGRPGVASKGLWASRAHSTGLAGSPTELGRLEGAQRPRLLGSELARSGQGHGEQG